MPWGEQLPSNNSAAQFSPPANVDSGVGMITVPPNGGKAYSGASVYNDPQLIEALKTIAQGGGGGGAGGKYQFPNSDQIAVNTQTGAIYYNSANFGCWGGPGVVPSDFKTGLPIYSKAWAAINQQAFVELNAPIGGAPVCVVKLP
jgi:hypothetical protein